MIWLIRQILIFSFIYLLSFSPSSFLNANSLYFYHFHSLNIVVCLIRALHIRFQNTLSYPYTKSSPLFKSNKKKQTKWYLKCSPHIINCRPHRQNPVFSLISAPSNHFQRHPSPCLASQNPKLQSDNVEMSYGDRRWRFFIIKCRTQSWGAMAQKQWRNIKQNSRFSIFTKQNS